MEGTKGMNPPYKRALLGAALSIVLLGAVPAVALAGGNPSCGSTLMNNTTLTGNLDCSGYTGTALYMGKNGVVLNLNGYTLFGHPDYDAIDTDGYNKTIIRNGTVDGAYSIYVNGSADTILRNLHVNADGANSNDFGVYDYYSAHTTLQNVDVTGNPYYGMYFEYSAGALLTGSDIDGGEYGVYNYNTTRNTMQDNIARADTGFYEEDSGGNRYINNRANNGEYGFDMECNGYGNVTMRGNRAHNNIYNGFYIYECYTGNNYYGSVIDGNRANNNGDGGFYDYYSINTRYTNNVANSNDGYGMYFDYPGGMVIRWNTTNNNDGSGVEIYENYSGDGYYNAKLYSQNTANDNGDYGHYADYPVYGTGNVADDNATQDCYQVSCV